MPHVHGARPLTIRRLPPSGERGGRDAGKASGSVQRGSRCRVEASDVRADSGATPAERQGEADRKVCVRPPNARNYLNLPQ